MEAMFLKEDEESWRNILVFISLLLFKKENFCPACKDRRKERHNIIFIAILYLLIRFKFESDQYQTTIRG